MKINKIHKYQIEEAIKKQEDRGGRISDYVSGILTEQTKKDIDNIAKKIIEENHNE